MPDEPESPQFSTDQALVNPADDQLDRDHFSQEIARSLANWRGHDSIVLSLSGEWGTGKSTIKNFIIYHLRHKATIVEFNPWQWSGQDKLLEGFLWQLGAIFGKKDITKTTRKLASKWKAFSAFTKLGSEVSRLIPYWVFALLSITALTSLAAALFRPSPWLIWLAIVTFLLFLFLSAISRLADKFSSALRDWAVFREKSLEELRSDVEREMRKLDKPVVVFVDDIDRLTNLEIKLLVQLVKANAQFPNLVYFLIFQKDIVVNALSKITSDDGAKYLRKIIQIEFDVPTASERQMRGILGHGLDRIINKHGVKLRWDQTRWQNIFLDDLWPYFTSLRDIKRFLGSFEFYFNLHVNNAVLEVNPIDLIAIEVLRMFDHDAFRAVSKSFLRNDDTVIGLLYRSENVAKHYAEQIDGIVKRKTDRPRLKHLLQSLFPQSVGETERRDWKRDFRICDELSFYKYFQLALDPAKPTAYEITRFVELSIDRSQLVTLLSEAIRKNTIEELLEFVFATKEELPLDNMPIVVTALFDIGDELPEQTKSIFSTGLDMHCNRIIYQRLRHETQKQSTDVLWQAYSTTTGFILPIHTLALEDRRVRERGEKEAFIIAESSLDDFIALTLDRIRSKASDFSLIEHKDCGYVLYRWRDWSGSNEANAWLKRVLSNSSHALIILRQLMSIATIGNQKERFLHGESVETLIDLETLYAAVSAVPPDQLNPQDAINVTLLSKAVRLKSEGKPYKEVHPDNSRL
jgi:predicted KAP-like P-loop ATPase